MTFLEKVEVSTDTYKLSESPRLQEATSGPDRQWGCSLLHQLHKAVVFTCMFCSFDLALAISHDELESF